MMTHLQERESLNRVTFSHCGVVRCEPAWSWSPPPLVDFDLWYVFSGHGEMRLGAARHAVVPGFACLLSPGQQPRATHDPLRPLGVCYLHFSLASKRLACSTRTQLGTALHLPQLPERCHLTDVLFHELVLRRTVELAGQNNPLASRRAAGYLLTTLTDMAATALEPPMPPDEREWRDQFSAIARAMEENPGRTRSIAELADAAGYSADHFARRFARAMGCMPKEFALRVRVRRAQQLLRETGLSLDQIARALGYRDAFFFSRQFRQRVGVSPSRWRRMSATGTPMAAGKASSQPSRA